MNSRGGKYLKRKKAGYARGRGLTASLSTLAQPGRRGARTWPFLKYFCPSPRLLPGEKWHSLQCFPGEVITGPLPPPFAFLIRKPRFIVEVPLPINIPAPPSPDDLPTLPHIASSTFLLPFSPFPVTLLIFSAYISSFSSKRFLFDRILVANLHSLGEHVVYSLVVEKLFRIG